MIDPRSGDLVLDSGLRIGPTTTRSSLSATATREEARPPHYQLSLGTQRVGGRPFVVTLDFLDERLRDASLLLDDPTYGTSWSDADEPGRKDAHDAWLRALFGAPHVPAPAYDFAWGEVFSTYDPRGEVSTITIRYGDWAPRVSGAGRRR
jgi:hypothetical protein